VNRYNSGRIVDKFAYKVYIFDYHRYNFVFNSRHRLGIPDTILCD